jgi:CheY-like chemotaxis protein
VRPGKIRGTVLAGRLVRGNAETTTARAVRLEIVPVSAASAGVSTAPTPLDTQWAAFPRFRARHGLERVPPQPLPQLATGKAPDRPATAKVLVVDDESPLRLIYRVNLEDEGLEVVEAADGRTGLEKAKTESPDLILLDVMMPGLNGWQVAKYLRAEPATRAIPFIFVTPLSQYRDRLYGLALGAVDYITLPCDPGELTSRIRELLTSTPRGTSPLQA